MSARLGKHRAQALLQEVYLKAREREAFDFALASVAFAVKLSGSKIEEARLVLGGVAPIPWRCTSTEAMLKGKTLDDATAIAAGKDALKKARPLDHNAYKIPLTQGLIRKAFKRLA